MLVRLKCTQNGVDMTDTGSSRRGFRMFTRAVAVMGIAVLGLAMSNGIAAAGVDNSSSVTDTRGNRIEVLQGDTQFQVVPPLDGVPTSVEFFHNGYAGVNITGPNATHPPGPQIRPADGRYASAFALIARNTSVSSLSDGRLILIRVRPLLWRVSVAGPMVLSPWLIGTI